MVRIGGPAATSVVGAPGKNSNQGAVYVFTQNSSGYVLLQELTASDGVAGDQFGWAVSQGGSPAAPSYILIAAPGKQVNGNANQGAVYVFTIRTTTLHLCRRAR